MVAIDSGVSCFCLGSDLTLELGRSSTTVVAHLLKWTGMPEEVSKVGRLVRPLSCKTKNFLSMRLCCSFFYYDYQSFDLHLVTNVAVETSCSL